MAATIPRTTNAANRIAMAHPAVFSKRVRRMLGLSLHGWENAMVVFLIIAGFFALIAGAATWAVVRLQRIEIAESNEELERYKLDAGKSISEANARANEANQKAESERLERLRLEAVVAPRSLSLSQQNIIAEFLKPFSGKRVSVTTYSLDGEGASLATQIIASLNGATIEVDNNLASVMPMGGFALGVHVNGDDSGLVEAIRTALGGVGGLFVAPPNTPAPLGGASMQTAPADGSKPVAASILVGIKPVMTIR
jgi:hypothetical protein